VDHSLGLSSSTFSNNKKSIRILIVSQAEILKKAFKAFPMEMLITIPNLNKKRKDMVVCINHQNRNFFSNNKNLKCKTPKIPKTILKT